MAHSLEQINEAFTRINEATNNIADDIRRLTEDIVEGISAADAVEVVTKANTIATRLEEVAAITPEPDEPPVEEPEA